MFRPGESSESSRRLRLSDFNTRHVMLLRFQPYAPAAFTPQEIFLVLISVTIEPATFRLV